MRSLLAWLWHYEIRLVPVLLCLSLFAILHYIRKLTKFAYTPSYFAIFPLSLLDYQLSEYFGEFWYGEYIDAKKRAFNSSLFVRSLLSFFATFFIIPFIVGFILAFILSAHELWAFLILLLIWQATNCFRATYDFFSNRGEKTVWTFFGSFYIAYLVCLLLVIRYGYAFALPFASTGNISGLIEALETSFVRLVLQVAAIAVLSGLFTHWLINKDALKPETSNDEESKSISTQNSEELRKESE